MIVVDFLKHGRENAIRADVLAAAMGTTPRGLRRQIMLAREQGVPLGQLELDAKEVL